MTETVHGVPLAQVRQLIGSPGQLARIDQLVESQGSARGARRMRLVTGGGLEIELHPDRALDIGQVAIDGVGLSWMSPTGMASPHLADHQGLEWLRTFGGGMLATCGLDYFGAPHTDQGQPLGLHGRIGTTPATVTSAIVDDDGLTVTAEIRQAVVHNENLLLRRQFHAPLGGRRLTLRDEIVNEGYKSTPLMVLYHCNVGWPLISSETVLDFGSDEVEPRDAAALAALDEVYQFGPPDATGEELVYQHSYRGPRAMVSVRNLVVGIGMQLSFDTAELPYAYQWKMLCPNQYVTGIEPANCAGVTGRGPLRESAGVLPVIEPGQVKTFGIDWEFDSARRAEPGGSD